MNIKTIESLCKLIETCGKSKVSELTYGDIRVVFKGENMPEQQLIVASKPGPTVESKKDKPDAYEQLDLALIENPAEYERMLTSGELENAESEDQ